MKVTHGDDDWFTGLRWPDEEQVIPCDPDGRWSAVEAIGPDGNPVVFIRDFSDVDEWARCCCCPPDHEQTGPLPDDVWLRLWPVEEGS